jgi:hypothetical protein
MWIEWLTLEYDRGNRMSNAASIVHNYELCHDSVRNLSVCACVCVCACVRALCVCVCVCVNIKIYNQKQQTYLHEKPLEAKIVIAASKLSNNTNTQIIS